MHGPSLAAERRRVLRHSTKARATAIIADNVMRGCFVTDFSHRGARLGLGASTPLPLRFELLFPTGQRLKATLIWQYEMTAGVAFDMPLNILDRLCIWSWLRRSELEAAQHGAGG
jgi:hypothetical protein